MASVVGREVAETGVSRVEGRAPGDSVSWFVLNQAEVSRFASLPGRFRPKGG